MTAAVPEPLDRAKAGAARFLEGGAATGGSSRPRPQAAQGGTLGPTRAVRGRGSSDPAGNDASGYPTGRSGGGARVLRDQLVPCGFRARGGTPCRRSAHNDEILRESEANPPVVGAKRGAGAIAGRHPGARFPHASYPCRNASQPCFAPHSDKRSRPHPLLREGRSKLPVAALTETPTERRSPSPTERSGRAFTGKVGQRGIRAVRPSRTDGAFSA